MRRSRLIATQLFVCDGKGTNKGLPVASKYIQTLSHTHTHTAINKETQVSQMKRVKASAWV